MRILACTVVIAASSGCSLLKDDCAHTRSEARGAFTALLAAGGEGAFDSSRYRETITAWKDLAGECRFPPAEVTSVATALEAAYADDSPTKAELEPILKEVEKMVTAMGGPAASAATAKEPAIMVGACEFRENKGFEDFPPDFVKDGLAGSRSTRETAKKIDDLAQSADINLFALAQAEIAHHAKGKPFVAFPKGGTAADWKALGVTFPAPVRHTFKAVPTKQGGLDLVAEGNLDNDSFVDRWLLQYDGKNGKNACPRALVLAMDSLNASFEGGNSGGQPYVIVPAGTAQPRLEGVP